MKPSSHNNRCRTIVLAIVSQRVLLDKFTQLTQQSCMLQLAETVKVLQAFMLIIILIIFLEQYQFKNKSSFKKLQVAKYSRHFHGLMQLKLTLRSQKAAICMLIPKGSKVNTKVVDTRRTESAAFLSWIFFVSAMLEYADNLDL